MYVNTDHIINIYIIYINIYPIVNIDTIYVNHGPPVLPPHSFMSLCISVPHCIN